MEAKTGITAQRRLLASVKQREELQSRHVRQNNWTLHRDQIFYPQRRFIVGSPAGVKLY